MRRNAPPLDLQQWLHITRRFLPSPCAELLTLDPWPPSRDRRAQVVRAGEAVRVLRQRTRAWLCLENALRPPWPCAAPMSEAANLKTRNRSFVVSLRLPWDEDRQRWAESCHSTG